MNEGSSAGLASASGGSCGNHGQAVWERAMTEGAFKAAVRRIGRELDAAAGPRRELDRRIAEFGRRLKPEHVGKFASGPDAPHFTACQTLATGLIEHILPGWWWSCGTCCVSDDARIAPDFNSPVHGERLRKEYFPLQAGSELDGGFDIDRRPPGNVPIAILQSLFAALADPQVRRAVLAGAGSGAAIQKR